MADTATKLPLKTETAPQAQKTPAPRRAHPFESLRHEVDRLFNEFSLDWPHWSLRGRPFTEPFWRLDTKGLMPAADVAETEKEYRITAELPGMDEKNVEVVLSESTITVKGEKKEEKEETKKDYHYSERSYGSFQRSFALPENVDAEKIEASMNKGVLTLVLPKTAEARSKVRKVEIKSK